MFLRGLRQLMPHPPNGERPVRLVPTGPRRRLHWTLVKILAGSMAAFVASGSAPASPGGPLDRAGIRVKDVSAGVLDERSLPAVLPPHPLLLAEQPRLDLVNSVPTQVVPGAARSTTVNRSAERAGVFGDSTPVNEVPAGAQRAYRMAALALRTSDPSCGLDWALLAGIGRVESDHGRYGGASLDPGGVARPLIIGIPLDGRPGVAQIGDTDRGVLDGDSNYDRAVGPMQFLPETWAQVGGDGDGDGRSDPNDIDDAALAAARYLCAGDARLDDVPGARTALMRYNRSADYGLQVLRIAAAYRLGGIVDAVTPAMPPTTYATAVLLTSSSTTTTVPPQSSTAAKVPPASTAAKVPPASTKTRVPPTTTTPAPTTTTPAPTTTTTCETLPISPGQGPTVLPTTAPPTAGTPTVAAPEPTCPTPAANVPAVVQGS